MKKRKSEILEDGSYFQRGFLVEKSFVNKVGKSSDKKELYLRCSVQDYFIKFCESEINVEDILHLLNTPVSFRIKIKTGAWDICEDDDPNLQSRIGDYIVVYEFK